MLQRAMRVYLAGPEVFLPDARAVLDRKAALAQAHGFTPVQPGDLGVPPADTPHALGLAISAVDEEMMLGSDLIIANMTPFRGLSADVGTAFEIGFMCALGRPAFAYTNVAAGYFERVVERCGHPVARAPDGHVRDPDGMMVEDCAMADNLMLDGGIERRGGVVVRRAVEGDRLFTDLAAFEECLAIAARRLGVAQPA